MPIPTHSPSTLNRMKKELLTQHVLELYEFIEIFSGNSIADLTNQIKDLKKQNNDLNNSIIWEWNEQVIALKIENKEWEQSNCNYTKLLSEERTRNVELHKELERSQKLFAAQPLVKHIEELKEEISKKSQTDNNLKRVISLKEKHIEELQEEIEKLKEELRISNVTGAKLGRYSDFLTKENKNLEEELKKKIESIKKITNIINE